MDIQTHLLDISEASFSFWKQSYDIDNSLWKVTKTFMISKYVEHIDAENICLKEKCAKLKEAYESEMSTLILKYSKRDIIYACMCLKSYFAKIQCKTENRIKHLLSEQASIIYILMIGLRLDNNKFKNASFFRITDSHSYFIDIIALSRLYVFLCDNITRLDFFTDRDNLNIYNVAFEQLENEAFNKYYSEFEKQADFDRPEDHIFENEGVEAKIKLDRKTIPDLISQADSIICKHFGFHIEALLNISQFFLQCRYKDENMETLLSDDVILFPIAHPKKILTAIDPNIATELDKIIQTFTIRNYDDRDAEIEKHLLEFACFYVDNEYVFFEELEFSLISDMFSKIALSGNHLDMWLPDSDIARQLTEEQGKISNYMCYVLADILISNAYKMHMEPFTYERKKYISPVVEDKAMRPNGIKIANKIGDYDVLFLDDFKNQIVIVEFKYFKPGITFSELMKADRNKITNQVIGKNGSYDKILKRENAVKDNMEYFIEYLNGDLSKSYSVKSIVVTQRPNLYSFETNKKNASNRIDILSVNSFVDRVIKHDI